MKTNRPKFPSLFSLIGCALLAVTAIPATAQNLARELRSASVTTFPTSVAASTTTTLTSSNAVFSLVPGSGVGLVLKFTGSAADVSNVTVKFGVSENGSTISTQDHFTWIVPANGTTAVIAYTNVPATFLNNVPFLAVRSVVNGNTNSITSVSLKGYTAAPPRN